MAARDDSKASESNTSTKATAKTADTQVNEDSEAPQNTGAVSAEQQAVRTGVSSDALNPAFASPEAQEQIKKEWAGEAEHTVDAEKVLKGAEGDNK